MPCRCVSSRLQLAFTNAADALASSRVLSQHGRNVTLGCPLLLLVPRLDKASRSLIASLRPIGPRLTGLQALLCPINHHLVTVGGFP